MNPLVNNKITTELNDSAGRFAARQITEELLSQFSEPIIKRKTSGEILFGIAALSGILAAAATWRWAKTLEFWNYGIG